MGDPGEVLGDPWGILGGPWGGPWKVIGALWGCSRQRSTFRDPVPLPWGPGTGHLGAPAPPTWEPGTPSRVTGCPNAPDPYAIYIYIYIYKCIDIPISRLFLDVKLPPVVFGNAYVLICRLS